MKLRKKLLGLAGITLGGIGMLACVAAIVLLWITSARLEQMAGSLFEKTDRSLVLIQQRVIQLQKRVATAATTAEDLEKSLRDWTKQAAVQRIASRAEIAERAKHLVSTLEEAERWLEISEASVEIIQNMLSLRAATMTPTDTGSVDRVLEELATLRAQLANAMEFVTTIHDRLTKNNDEKSLEERFQQGMRLAVRVVATLGTTSNRLENLAERLTDSQSQVQRVKAETRRWFLFATIGVTLLITWMGTGQLAICLLAWNRWR
jgi:hypothetical protein